MPEEVTILKRELAPIAGGENNLSFDLLKGKMGVLQTGNPSLTPSDIVNAVSKTSMKAEVWKRKVSVEETFWHRRKRVILTAVSGISAALGFISHAVIARNFMAAVGSEGMGISHEVPLPAKFFYLASPVILSG